MFYYFISNFQEIEIKEQILTSYVHKMFRNGRRMAGKSFLNCLNIPVQQANFDLDFNF